MCVFGARSVWPTVARSDRQTGGLSRPKAPVGCFYEQTHPRPQPSLPCTECHREVGAPVKQVGGLEWPRVIVVVVVVVVVEACGGVVVGCGGV